MKAKLIITLAALLLLSSVATATDTRVRTMGDNNMVLLDEANITIFPSRLNEYPNLAIGEFGVNDFYEMGVHWKFNKDNPWVLGTYISTPPIGVPRGYYDGTIFGHFTESFGSTNKRIDLYYGRQNFPGTNNFGFHFGYTRASNEYTDSTDAYVEKFFVYEFGFGITNAAKDFDAAVHLMFGGWTDEMRDTSSVIESDADGYMELGAVARKFKSFGDYTMIYHAEVLHGKRGWKDHVADNPNNAATKDDQIMKDTRFMVDLGCGVNWTPALNVLVVGDFGIAIDNIKREYTTTANYYHPFYPDGAGSSVHKRNRTYFPYWSIGFDADVFKWMDIRMGASSDWIAEKREYAWDPLSSHIEGKDGYAANDTYLGFGFHWGRLHVDTETDPDLFLRGFDFITGKGTGTDMNARISVVYELM